MAERMSPGERAAEAMKRLADALIAACAPKYRGRVRRHEMTVEEALSAELHDKHDRRK